MQQKRLLEGQPKVITATSTNLLNPLSSTSTITSGVKSVATVASGTLLKTSGGMTTLLSSGNVVKKITQMQPKATGTGNVSVSKPLYHIKLSKLSILVLLMWLKPVEGGALLLCTILIL